MTTKELLKTSAFAALAAAMTASALPEEAMARDNDRGGWSQRSSDRGSARSSRSDDSSQRTTQRTTQRSESRPQPRSEQRSERSYTQRAPQQSSYSSPGRQAQQQRSYTPPRQVSVPPSRADTRSPSGETRTTTRVAESRNRSYSDRNRSRSYSDRSPSSNRSSSTYQPRVEESRRTYDRNRSYSDGNRNRSYSDGNRTNNYRDGYRDGRRDTRNWDRRWRDNRRYDWYGYRNRNRSLFHIGVYYAPYRNYYYSRLSIGYYLDSLFFGSRYWIDDPWRYRLPEVYGPYRWIRYYDDVLLVDMYTGEVVDVIYDFFW